LSIHSDFYSKKIIRKRIEEFIGDAQYIVGYGRYLKDKDGVPFRSFERYELDFILSKGLDVYRSVWDMNSVLAILDVEYFNLDYPGEVYLKPERVFGILEDVYRVIMEEFSKYKITPLTTVTGQGYHFVFKISKKNSSYKELEKVGYVSPTLEERYKMIRGRKRRPVSRREGRSFDGMGRILEYFTHKVIKRLKDGGFKFPLQITDVAVGRGEVGREAISIDLSMYGDPIYMRDIRTPFSFHQKHKVDIWKVGRHVSEGVPVQIAIPRNNASISKILKLRRNPEKAVKYAYFHKTEIPDFSEEFLNLISDYKNSSLYLFHKEFDSFSYKKKEDYERFDLRNLPSCLSYTISFPNPNLLKPTNLQTITRVFMKLGWHPKEIAGFVAFKFENPEFNWHEDWRKYDPQTRANFYIRIFSSLIKCGIDGELDLNCISHQEKGYCIRPWCGWNLADFKIV